MAFHVGQKVVCILDRWVNLYGGEQVPGPKKGEVCTITKISSWNKFTMIDLAGWGRCYSAANFRPVVEKPTSIAIFTAMLTPSPKQVERV
jgi:hypothetical protein